MTDPSDDDGPALALAILTIFLIAAGLPYLLV
jgi:hypothetical protein